MFRSGSKALLIALCVTIMVPGSVSLAAEDENVPLSVSIVVPIRHGKRLIELNHLESHFHVVLKNISTHDVSLWREWCSWGYFNLSFEVTDSTGKTWTVKKKERGWNRNYPDFATIAPNGNFVIDVTFDPEIWDNLPLPEKGKSHTVAIRAIYEITESDDAKKGDVWTGRVVSEKKEYTIWR